MPRLLLLFMNVERNTQTKREPWSGTWKVPRVPALASAQECAAPPFITSPTQHPSTAPCHQQAEVQPGTRALSQTASMLGSFTAPKSLLLPSLGLHRQAAFIHLASSSYSFQRSNSLSLPLQLLPWLSWQSWSSCPSLTHGTDSVIAVHVLAGVSEGSSSPSTASLVLLHV